VFWFDLDVVFFGLVDEVGDYEEVVGVFFGDDDFGFVFGLLVYGVGDVGGVVFV